MSKNGWDDAVSAGMFRGIKFEERAVGPAHDDLLAKVIAERDALEDELANKECCDLEELFHEVAYEEDGESNDFDEVVSALRRVPWLVDVVVRPAREDEKRDDREDRIVVVRSKRAEFETRRGFRVSPVFGRDGRKLAGREDTFWFWEDVLPEKRSRSQGDEPRGAGEP